MDFPIQQQPYPVLERMPPGGQLANLLLHPTTSFTPINQHVTPMQYINPLQTLYQDIPSDSWFPQDGHTLLETAFDGITKGTKRGRGKKNQLAVLKDVNGHDEVEFRVSAPISVLENDCLDMGKPKKKKARTSRCVSKKKTQETPTQSVLAESTSSSSMPPPTTIAEKKTRGHPRKKTSEQTSLSHEQKPFKLPMLTKPMSQDRDACKTTDNAVCVVIDFQPPIDLQKINSSSITQHPPRLTTEEALKQNENLTTISKTTLRKFKSFMYSDQPSATEALDNSHKDQRKPDSQDENDVLQGSIIADATKIDTEHEQMLSRDTEGTQSSGVVVAESCQDILPDTMDELVMIAYEDQKDHRTSCHNFPDSLRGNMTINDAHTLGGREVEIVSHTDYNDQSDKHVQNSAQSHASQLEGSSRATKSSIYPPENAAEASIIFQEHGHMEVDTFDEYDDCLDDADLLDMENTQTNHKSIEQDRVIRDASNIQHQHVRRIVEVVLDDEFDIDEDDEEAMLQLPELISNTSICSVSDLHKEETNSEGFDGSVTVSSPAKQRRVPPPVKQTEKVASMNAISPPSSDSVIKHALITSMTIGKSSSQSAKTSALNDLRENQNTDEAVILRSNDRLEDADSITASTGRRCNVSTAELSADLQTLIVLDSNYTPLNTFARPNFPSILRERSPVIGLSGNTFLRTCFKIGELLNEGRRCDSFGQEAVIELFARVVKSNREEGTTKQYFTFFDLWSDYPPHPPGVLDNHRSSALVESESRVFIDAASRGECLMARCIGRLIRDVTKDSRCQFHIHNIRETDWEEVRWTKQIVSACGVKSEKV